MLRKVNSLLRNRPFVQALCTAECIHRPSYVIQNGFKNFSTNGLIKPLQDVNEQLKHLEKCLTRKKKVYLADVDNLVNEIDQQKHTLQIEELQVVRILNYFGK